MINQLKMKKFSLMKTNKFNKNLIRINTIYKPNRSPMPIMKTPLAKLLCSSLQKTKRNTC